MYSEHKILFDVMDKLYPSIQGYDDDDTWLRDIDEARQSWVKLQDIVDSPLFDEMVEKREWERSGAHSTLVGMFKAIRAKYPDEFKYKLGLPYEWCVWIRNGLRVYDNPRLYYYHELESDIPIASNEIVGGRTKPDHMLYTYDSRDNKYYAI